MHNLPSELILKITYFLIDDKDKINFIDAINRDELLKDIIYDDEYDYKLINVKYKYKKLIISTKIYYQIY